jgi:hypothetical protein
MLTKIISGGQTGADQGALAAAKILGIPTGGVAPKGYRTDTGPNLDLCLIYDLTAHSSRDYRPRTKENVVSSDGTLLFGNLNSPGTLLTRDLCVIYHKPIIKVHWTVGIDKQLLYYETDLFIQWLFGGKIKILNVAGNRESTNPGIFEATKTFLVEALRGIA